MSKVKLGDVSEVFLSNIDKKSVDGQIKVRLCNFTDVYYNWAITQEMYDSFMKATATNSQIENLSISKGMVAITKDSETKYDIGVSAYIADDFDDVVLGYHCVLIKPNKDLLSGKYLNVIFHSSYAQKYFENHASGSGQRYTLSKELIEDMRIPYVAIEDQNKIGDIFSKIDRKIEINKQINDNLEKQAKLLYEYWFTQFDFPDENGKPYRSSNGKMVWNEQLKRDIPEGWEVKSLAEILQKNTDVFDYKSTQPAVDLSIMPSNSIAISQLNSSDSFSTNLFEMKKGDILFGSIRPYLHKAGFAPFDGVVAGTVHSFRVKNNQDYNFALMTVSRDNFFNYAVNVSSGTKMPVVSSDSILDYKVPYNNKIVNRYNKIPLISIISSLIQENQKLISLRDWLLPMLMNGQATISD